MGVDELAVSIQNKISTQLEQVITFSTLPGHPTLKDQPQILPQHTGMEEVLPGGSVQGKTIVPFSVWVGNRRERQRIFLNIMGNELGSSKTDCDHFAAQLLKLVIDVFLLPLVRSTGFSIYLTLKD